MTATLAPAPPQTPAPPDRPRDIRSRTLDDTLSLAGAAVGSFALVWILTRWILPLRGPIVFLMLWYLAFLGLYLVVSAVGNPRTLVVDRMATAVVTGGAVLIGLALVSAVGFTFFRGAPALPHLNLYFDDMAGVRPTDPLSKGGIAHAIAGSLVEIGIAVSLALPLGVGTAVFMVEVGGKFARIVRTVVEAMTALPSIVAGLFIYTVLIVTIHFPKSGFAASMALFVMGLPIIARAADVVLRVVPGGLREAGMALGASQWRTVWHVVLPTARPGLATALILGVARMIGETSPVLLTSGMNSSYNGNPFHEIMTSLPIYIFSSVRSGEPVYIQRGYGAASVLLALVLLLFVAARRAARRRGSAR